MVIEWKRGRNTSCMFDLFLLFTKPLLFSSFWLCQPMVILPVFLPFANFQGLAKLWWLCINRHLRNFSYQWQLNKFYFASRVLVSQWHRWLPTIVPSRNCVTYAAAPAPLTVKQNSPPVLNSTVICAPAW